MPHQFVHVHVLVELQGYGGDVLSGPLQPQDLADEVGVGLDDLVTDLGQGAPDGLDVLHLARVVQGDSQGHKRLSGLSVH